MHKSGKLNSFLNGAGFYIVLFLAIVVIVASGYFVYKTVSGGQLVPPQSADTSLAVSEQHEHPLVKDTETPPPPAEERQSVSVSGTTQISATAPVPESPKDHRIVQPLQGETITPYSIDELIYNETMGDWRTHDGIDIAAAEGTKVVSAAAGKVASIVDDYWMGTSVTVSCDDGYELVYASLEQGVNVSVGDTVAPGDSLGVVGATSLLEEDAGTHLHFSVTQNGVAIDPGIYLSNAE